MNITVARSYPRTAHISDEAIIIEHHWRRSNPRFEIVVPRILAHMRLRFDSLEKAVKFIKTGIEKGEA